MFGWVGVRRCRRAQAGPGLQALTAKNDLGEQDQRR